jgi:tetratricopeptide (TPR) repeat protein
VPYLNRAIARESLGVRLAEAGQPEAAAALWADALADCDAAIARDPKEFAAHFNRGNVAMRLGDYAGAQADFTRAADLAPGIAGYRLRSAQLAFQNGDDAGALRLMRGLARKYPNYSEAHASVAAVLWATGQGAAAEGAFEAAKEYEMSWTSMDAVRAATRWPPRLYDALAAFLALEAGGGGGSGSGGSAVVPAAAGA